MSDGGELIPGYLEPLLYELFTKSFPTITIDPPEWMAVDPQEPDEYTEATAEVDPDSMWGKALERAGL